MRVETLFDAAVALPPATRGAYLDAQCAGDAALRTEVEALLDADEGGADRYISGIVDRAVIDLPAPGLGPSYVGRQVGPYRLVAELGHGGMGTVYLADRADAAYHARVAIKFVRGGLAGADAERRFRAERQILADLAHPNIARLIDGGAADDGTPYLVMDLVDGEAIDRYCEHRSLDLRARLDLFRVVCAAVQYAHQALVIHRDLKPSNILVTADGAPKLLDFGIAKLLDADSAAAGDTGTLARALTPTYASPEHIRGARVTVATDVYSLGVVLYKLLTGRVPFEVPAGSSPGDIERLVCEAEPTRPSILNRGLAADLEAIVLKALRKEPERRYASVGELSDDVRRFLAREPVTAARGTTTYRFSKFVRRHAQGLVLASAILVGVSGIVGYYTMRVARARDRARLEAARAEQVSRFLTQTFAVADPEQGLGTSGPNATARDLLLRGTRRIESELAGQPATQATMFGAVGRAYQGLGLYGQATPLFERALELKHQIGADDLEIARAEYDLGGLATAKGDYPTADSLLRSALARRRAALPWGDPALVRSLVALAQVAYQRAQYEAAERLLSEAAEMARRLSGADRQELAQVLGSLGEVRLARGEYAAADSLLQEELVLRRKVFGESHPSVPATLNRLGNLRMEQGAYAAAESLQRQAVTGSRRILGDDHPTVASQLSDLARALIFLDRRAEADSLLRTALQRHRERLGDAHPLVASDMLGLASLYYRSERLADGERMAREALRRFQGHYGPAHPQIVWALNGLGNILSERGDFPSAVAYYREAVAAARQLFGDGHDATLTPLINLGQTYQVMEQYEEAERTLREALTVAERVLGAEHPATDQAVIQLCALYTVTGRSSKAEPFARRSLEYRRRVLGDMNPYTADAFLCMSVVAADTGRGAEAERLAREALRIYTTAGLGDQWLGDLARVVLGRALHAQQRYAEAEPLLLRGYRTFRAQWPSGSSYGSWTRKELVSLYESWGRPERASQFRH